MHIKRCILQQVMQPGCEMLLSIMDLINDVVVNPETGFVLENQTTGSESSFWEEVGRAQPERVQYTKEVHTPSGQKKKVGRRQE